MNNHKFFVTTRTLVVLDLDNFDTYDEMQSKAFYEAARISKIISNSSTLLVEHQNGAVISEITPFCECGKEINKDEIMVNDKKANKLYHADCFQMES